MRERASGGNSHHQSADTDNVDRAAQIVGERRQVELGANLFEPAHQEGALIHPLLDAAEGMLDGFATAIKDIGFGGEGKRSTRDVAFDGPVYNRGIVAMNSTARPASACSPLRGMD